MPLSVAMRSGGSGDYAEPVPDNLAVPVEVKEEVIEDTPVLQTFYGPRKAVPLHLVDLDSDMEDSAVPEGGLVMEVPNVVTQTVEAAAAAGIEYMRLPAPVEHGQRHATSAWSLLYADHAARWIPGVQDMGVLERSHRFPSEATMRSYASPGTRMQWRVDPSSELVPGAVSYTHLTLPTICSV